MSEEQVRKEMIDFLSHHFRYYTMNSWNRSTSYARNVKIHNLDLTAAQRSKAYDMIYAEGTFDEINMYLEDFAVNHEHKYQAAFNGRSGGYIVMIQGGQKPSGYQSYCTKCGQLNYAKVILHAETKEDKLKNYVRTHNTWIPQVYINQQEVKDLGIPEEEVLKIVIETKNELLNRDLNYTIDNKCGSCGRLSRVNFDKPHMQIYTQPGLGMDEDPDFEDEDNWDNNSLKARYDLVKEFDMMVDDCIATFKEKLDNCDVIEETIMIPRTVTRLKCKMEE